MKLTKQTVLFPFGVNGLPLHERANVEECMASYKKETGYFFTPEQLNQLLSDVIKDALNTAAEKATYKHNGLMIMNAEGTFYNSRGVRISK